MKFEVRDRDNNEVAFIADIDADENTPESVKLGLAVKWAYKNKISLEGCNLRGAHLCYAKLPCLEMHHVDLSEANLYGANLHGCKLVDAFFVNANLSKSDLSFTDLMCADLTGADISGVELDNTTGNMKEIRTMLVDSFPISFTKDILQIGDMSHPIKQWHAFTDEEIKSLSTDYIYWSLSWWKKWKEVIFETIRLSFDSSEENQTQEVLIENKDMEDQAEIEGEARNIKQENQKLAA